MFHGPRDAETPPAVAAGALPIPHLVVCVGIVEIMADLSFRARPTTRTDVHGYTPKVPVHTSSFHAGGNEGNENLTPQISTAHPDDVGARCARIHCKGILLISLPPP